MILHPATFDQLIQSVDNMAVGAMFAPREAIVQQLVQLAAILRMMADRDADESSEPDAIKLLHDSASRVIMMDELNRIRKGGHNG